MEQELLVERAKRGDRAAFAQLVTLNRDAVYRAAYWVLKDPDEALDATQEAFLKAFRAIDRFEGRSSFRTWARTIATRVAIDRYGRRQRRRTRTAALDEQAVADSREAPKTRPPAPSDAAWSARRSRSCRPRSGPPSCCATSRGCPTRRSPTG